MKHRVALLVVIALALPAVAQNKAEDLYKAKCAMCHGADGTGNTPAGKKLGVQDFHAPELLKKSDADLMASITNGVQKDGKQAMPGYKGKLTEDQIKDLVAYVRSLGKAK